MTPDQLRRLGSALYGARWQRSLAREVGVSDRTIRRWAAGEWPIPDDRAEEIGKLARRRGQELFELGASADSVDQRNEPERDGGWVMGRAGPRGRSRRRQDRH